VQLSVPTVSPYVKTSWSIFNMHEYKLEFRVMGLMEVDDIRTRGVYPGASGSAGHSAILAVPRRGGTAAKRLNLVP